MEDDDGCVHSPVTDVTEVHSGDTSSKGSEFISTSHIVSCGYNKETDNGESVDDVFVTPPKHNRVIEDKDDFVDPPVTQATQFQGGEAFMKGIQVSEMYEYNDVVPAFNDMVASGFNPHGIDYIKEYSDRYIGRMFKDKTQFKLTMAIYAISKACTFKFRHAKRFITAKCLYKECAWKVMAKQLGDSPTYLVKKAILDHTCASNVRGQYIKHGTSKVLAALLRSKYERLHCGIRACELPELQRTELNYTCTYWKAKELKIAYAQGTKEMSYKMLPQYFHVLKYTNPRTITDIKTEIDKEGKTRFKYAFMSLKACIDGWMHLRKVLVVDGAHMFEKYKGCLLSASGQDTYN